MYLSLVTVNEVTGENPRCQHRTLHVDGGIVLTPLGDVGVIQNGRCTYVRLRDGKYYYDTGKYDVVRIDTVADAQQGGVEKYSHDLATVLPEDVAKHLNYITSQIYGEETNNA